MLASQFPTVELASTFYRVPSVATIDRWAQSVPNGFVFSLKANRLITHHYRLRDAEQALAGFWVRAERLGKKLGPILFQIPAFVKVDIPRLSQFMSTLPVGIKAAFDFRDPSWFTDNVLDLLDRAGAAWVVSDRQGQRPRVLTTGGFGYVRLHQGQPEKPGYSQKQLARWADRIVGFKLDTFVYFNNPADAAAPEHAHALMTLLRERGAPVVEPPVTLPKPWPKQLRLFPTNV